jgi:hypothetical protein
MVYLLRNYNLPQFFEILYIYKVESNQCQKVSINIKWPGMYRLLLQDIFSLVLRLIF